MNWRDYIHIDPAVHHGTACFSGTRIPVALVLDNLAAGVPEAVLRRHYPMLPEHAVAAALAYSRARREEDHLG